MLKWTEQEARQGAFVRIRIRSDVESGVWRSKARRAGWGFLMNGPSKAPRVARWLTLESERPGRWPEVGDRPRVIGGRGLENGVKKEKRERPRVDEERWRRRGFAPWYYVNGETQRHANMQAVTVRGLIGTKYSVVPTLAALTGKWGSLVSAVEWASGISGLGVWGPGRRPGRMEGSAPDCLGLQVWLGGRGSSRSSATPQAYCEWCSYYPVVRGTRLVQIVLSRLCTTE